MRISDWSSDVCSSDLGVQRIFDKLPNAIAACLQGFALLRRNLLKAGGCGHFNEGLTVTQPTPTRIAWIAVRIKRLDATPLTCVCRQHRVPRAFPANGHGYRSEARRVGTEGISQC